MCEERAKIRCVQCELVQWADQVNCRRCGKALPAPIVNVVERVVEKVVIQQDSQCLENLLEASKLISATAAKLQESRVAPHLPVHSVPISDIEPFPTLDVVERALIIANVTFAIVKALNNVLTESPKTAKPELIQEFKDIAKMYLQSRLSADSRRPVR